MSLNSDPGIKIEAAARIYPAFPSLRAISSTIIRDFGQGSIWQSKTIAFQYDNFATIANLEYLNHTNFCVSSQIIGNQI